MYHSSQWALLAFITYNFLHWTFTCDGHENTEIHKIDVFRFTSDYHFWYFDTKMNICYILTALRFFIHSHRGTFFFISVWLFRRVFMRTFFWLRFIKLVPDYSLHTVSPPIRGTQRMSKGHGGHRLSSSASLPPPTYMKSSLISFQMKRSDASRCNKSPHNDADSNHIHDESKASFYSAVGTLLSFLVFDKSGSDFGSAANDPNPKMSPWATWLRSVAVPSSALFPSRLNV